MSNTFGKHGFRGNPGERNPEARRVEHCRGEDFTQLLLGGQARHARDYLERPPVDERLCSENSSLATISYRDLTAPAQEDSQISAEQHLAAAPMPSARDPQGDCSVHTTKPHAQAFSY